MVDSGATTKFINKRFIEENKVQTQKLKEPIPLYNINGTLNKDRSISEVAVLQMHIGDTINAVVGKGNFPGTCFGCGKQGYRRFECPNCKDKPYTKHADARATVASGSTQAATSAPVTTSPLASISAASAKSEQLELANLMAQVKSMREELEHYRAMKEEGF
ncbi:hypothetical protein POSPLADRAFT_1057659 [Postia placenta MAD-698-R-SB12]|uniref:CCHC-type domain-containing protein n=1 Tax=Postia placenta MAD-698-R-SB12 TaxID=670580 RepID=A0A1X6MZV8_9APHY|nr:hypothetical protein POSPLADRAFT_1057659 [Postia placenta MAD-698-R-SB12]OSX61885.1 hypothetical protein POSPLADRAFT_1057659 [Postia placenta MAD-698-R-SB12]